MICSNNQHGSYSNEEYVTKRPQTSQEEDLLINAGFEFVRFDNKEDVPVYRKGSNPVEIWSISEEKHAFPNGK